MLFNNHVKYVIFITTERNPVNINVFNVIISLMILSVSFPTRYRASGWMKGHYYKTILFFFYISLKQTLYIILFRTPENQVIAAFFVVYAVQIGCNLWTKMVQVLYCPARSSVQIGSDPAEEDLYRAEKVPYEME